MSVEKYSVLMTVYGGEKPEFLKESLSSMLNQTLPPEQLVLACDGELTPELYSVIDSFSRKYGEVFEPLFLPENKGNAYAANRGLEKCRCEFVVRMDSDDISLPERCRKQVKLMEENPELDISGAYIREFDSETGEFISVKKTPPGHEEILEYSRRRNPFNNQTIIMRKSRALKIGGYSELRRCEDYDFACRLLMDGAKGANIPEVLVNYRVTPENYQRRSNWANTRDFISVRLLNFKRGYCSLWDFLTASLMQIFIFLMPKKLTGAIYKKFLR